MVVLICIRYLTYNLLRTLSCLSGYYYYVVLPGMCTDLGHHRDTTQVEKQ